jgi:chromosome segregation ATPase
MHGVPSSPSSTIGSGARRSIPLRASDLKVETSDHSQHAVNGDGRVSAKATSAQRVGPTGDVIARLMGGLRLRDLRTSELVERHDIRAREAEAAGARRAAELAAAAEALRETQSEATALRSTRVDLLSRLESAQQELARMKAKAEAASADAALHARDAEENRAAAVASDAALSRVNARAVELQEREAALRQRCGELDARAMAAEQRAATADASLAAAERKLAETSELCSELRGAVRDLTELERRRRVESDAQRDALEEVRARADWLEHEHAVAVAAVDAAEGESRRKDAEIARAVRRAEALEKELAKQRQVAAMIHNLSSALKDD